jgi:hypothetical protein
MRAFAVLGALLLLACGASPSSPDGCGSYDPRKPIDSCNRPPSPGGSVANIVKATATFGLQEGDCTANIQACTKGIEPEIAGGKATFLVKDHRTVNTLWMCVTHQQWMERKIGLILRIFTGAVIKDGLEQDPDMKSPVCVAATFNLVIAHTGSLTNSVGGNLNFTESNWDLFTSDNTITNWSMLVEVKVRGT